MKTIYIDSEFKCHTVNDGNMTPVETERFDGKCDTFVEGFCYETKDNGIAIYPWKHYDELAAAQREFERQQLADYETEIADLRKNSIPVSELNAAYQEGVNSV